MAAAGLHFGASWQRSRRANKLPPTVYLRNTDKVGFHGDKMFSIQWLEKSLSLIFRGDGRGMMNKDPILERNISLELFNAGEEAVRHVEVRWVLPDVDIYELGRVLGPPVQSFEDNQLKLASEGHGAIHPIYTDIKAAPIPLIEKAGHVQIEAPRAFTEAYAICALARAKQHHEKVLLPTVVDSAADPMAQLEAWKRPMDPVIVELSYVKSERTCRHAFVMAGYVYGGSQPMVHEPTEEAPNLYVPAPGVTAVVDNVVVYHKD